MPAAEELLVVCRADQRVRTYNPNPIPTLNIGDFSGQLGLLEHAGDPRHAFDACIVSMMLVRANNGSRLYC
jgi:hypothetical protein